MTLLCTVFVWPCTVGGWGALVAAVVLTVGAVGGFVFRIGRYQISNEVDRSVHTEVPAVVALALREVNAKLDGIRINQAELSAEMGRVRILETKIDNGITQKIALIEDRQDSLVVQIAEMHGWMQATHHWNGDDRRTT